MSNRMDPEDFQNIVYKCCSLLAFTKWSVVHTMCYNNEIEENLISASAQHCGECGYFLGGVVSLVHHTEKHHSASVCHVCTLCHLPYVTKVALDCHVAYCHGSVHRARSDYKRKYRLRMQ